MVAKNTSIRALASIFPSIIFDGKRFLILTRLFEFSINVCKHCQQVWWRLLNHQTSMLVLLKFKSTLADVVSQTFTKSQAWLKTQPQYKRWFQSIINCQKISSLKYVEAILIDYLMGSPGLTEFVSIANKKVFELMSVPYETTCESLPLIYCGEYLKLFHHLHRGACT